MQSDAMKKVREAALDLLDWFDGPSMDLEGPDGMGARFARLRAALDAEPDPPAGFAGAERWLYEYSEPLTDGKLRQSIRWVLHRLKDLERNQAGGLSEEDAAFLEQVAGDWVDSVPDEDTYTAYARRQDAARLRAIAARARQEGDHA